MSVSVVVNNKNGANYIADCLNSIYAQTFSPLEVIFFDNCSHDKSCEIVRKEFPQVKIFEADQPIGLATARNSALSYCNGEFVAFLDVDDTWLPSKIDSCLQLFSNPDIALVYTDALYVGSTSFLQSDRTDLVDGSCFRDLLKNYCVPFSTIVFRRNIIPMSGVVFNESLDLALDQEFILRVSSTSKIGVVKECLTRILLRDDSESSTNLLSFIREREHVEEILALSVLDFKNSYSRELRYSRRRLAVDVIARYVGTSKDPKIGEIRKMVSSKLLLLYSFVLLIVRDTGLLKLIKALRLIVLRTTRA